MNFSNKQEALEAAKSKVHKTLSHLDSEPSELGQSLSSLISDFKKQQDTAGIQLTAALNREIETHRQVVCTLQKASHNSLLEPLETLASYCPDESQNLKSTMLTKANIAHTLSILSVFQDLPATIANLKSQLSEKTQLISVVNQGLKLIETRNKILEKKDTQHLRDLFKPLDEFEEHLDTHIWKVIENAIEVGSKEPKALVRVMRVIHKIHSDPCSRVKENLQKGIQKRLSKLLETDNLETLAENTSTALKDLEVISQKVAPCFPQEYQIYEFCMNNYRSSIESAIQPHLQDLQKMKETPGILVLLFQWVSQYSQALSKYSPGALQDLDIQFLFAKLKELMPDFLQHMENLLSEWINRAQQSHISNQRILELANSQEPISDTFPEEMFTAINHQLNFVANRLQGEVLIEVLRVCTERLKSHQKKQSQRIQVLVSGNDPEMQLPTLSLIVNNSQRSSNHTQDLLNSCKRYFSEDFQLERLQNLFNKVQKGFISLCQEAASSAAVCVLKSIAFETLGKVMTSEWGSSHPVSAACATMEDYDKDLGQWLVSDLYARRFKKRFFEVLAVGYLERTLQALSKCFNSSLELGLVKQLGLEAPPIKNKKELLFLMNQDYKESIKRDKQDFIEFSNKFGFEHVGEEVFDILVQSRDQGVNQQLLEKTLQPLVLNHSELAKTTFNLFSKLK